MSIDARWVAAEGSGLRQVTGDEGLPIVVADFDKAPCVVFARVELEGSWEQAGDPWVFCTLRVSSSAGHATPTTPQVMEDSKYANFRVVKEPPPGSPPGTSPTSEDLTAESTVVNLMAAHSDAASAVVACVGAEARVKSADMMIISVDTAGVLTPSPLPY